MTLRCFRVYPLLLVLIAGWTLTGCGFTINQPANNAGVLDPVTINVTWNVNMSSIQFTIDGVDKTSAFTIDYANQKATASISLAPTGHTLVVSGNYYFLFTINTSSSSTFNVVIQ